VKIALANLNGKRILTFTIYSFANSTDKAFRHYLSPIFKVDSKFFGRLIVVILLVNCEFIRLEGIVLV